MLGVLLCLLLIFAAAAEPQLANSTATPHDLPRLIFEIGEGFTNSLVASTDSAEVNRCLHPWPCDLVALNFLSDVFVWLI